jgi:hypothetical protein
MSEAEFNEVINVAKVMSDYEKPWAVCGGWAIDLFLGRVTRAHKDVDLVVLRREQLIIQGYLLSRGWTLEKAVSGQLVPWQPGEWIDLPVHVIWCRNSGTSPDFIELVFNEVSDTNFLFRRNLSITLPVERMIILSAIGIPILAPEIVLLYKSPKPEDSVAASDFKNVLPGLSFERRDWLEASLKKLHPGHTWLKYL